MNKKNAKMLSGTLAATTVLTSAMGAAPVFAKGTDWNKVYENAYKAMQKAEQDKTQESINAARKAIAELAKNKSLMPLVGTLSEHVDGVQQGLFNDFYALMYVDGKEKSRMSQKEINEAREYVDSFATCAGNKQYTESWSSAVDKFQQNNVNETVAAVKKAQETKDAKDIEAAKTLIAELEASKNKDVLNAVAGEKAKVEAVEKEIGEDQTKVEEKAKKAVAEIEAIKVEELKLEVKEEVSTKIAEAKKAVEAVKSEETKKALTEKIVKAENNINAQFAKLEEAAKALKVEKVEFANLKKAVITFNKELDEASVKKAGNVRVFKGNDEVAGLTVKLAEDKKSVYVVNTANKFDQLQTYRFVISNVSTVAGEKLAKTELTAKASDNSFPTVVDVKAISPKTLVVKFSEPVTGLPEAAGVTEKIQIDGINAYLSGAVNVEKMLDENTAVISLGNALTVGEHTVKISDLKDEINLPLEDNSTKVTLVEDKVVPAVTKVIANKNTVTVTFNKVVDKSTVIAANVKVNGQEPQSIKTKDGQTYELTLAGANKLGLASLIEAKLTYNNIADNYGNKVEKEQTVVFTSEDDKVAPTMKVTKVNEDNSVEIAFTEKVENATVKANYELIDKDGKEIAGGIQQIVDSEKDEEKGFVFKVTLKDADKLSGKFSLKAIKDNTIVDESVRENKLAETTVAFELKDKVAPEVKGNAIYVQEVEGKDFNKDNDVKDSKFTIYFTKSMNPTTLLNKANYIFKNKSLIDLKDATLTVGKDNKSVAVTINRNGDAAQEAMVGATLRVLRLEDSVGNRIKDENKEIEFTPFVENTAFTAMIEKAELVSLNQVKLYAKEGQTITKVDPNKISFTQVQGLQVMKVDVVEGGSSVILTLNQNINGDVKNNDNEIKLKAASKAITNNEEMSNDDSVEDMKIADMVKASLVKKAEEAVKVEGNKVTLTFDEKLKPVAGEYKVLPENFIVTDENGRLAFDAYSVAVAEKTLVFTFPKLGFDSKVNIELANNVAIKDTNDLLINNFKVATEKAVQTAPVLAAKIMPGTVAQQIAIEANVAEGNKLGYEFKQNDEAKKNFVAPVIGEVKAGLTSNNYASKENIQVNDNKYVVIYELTAEDKVVKANVLEVKAGDKAVAAATNLDVVAADAEGLENNGKTKLTLPKLPAGATKFVYKAGQNLQGALVGSTVDGTFVEVPDNKIITAANRTHVTVAAVTADNKLVSFKDVTSVAIDFVPATSAKVEATNNFELATDLKGKTASLVVKVDGDNAENTFTLELNGKEANAYHSGEELKTAIEGAKTTSGTLLSTVANVTVSGSKVTITSKKAGTDSKVDVSATGANSADALTLTGFTAQNNAGTASQH